jgi:hypothetical protein
VSSAGLLGAAHCRPGRFDPVGESWAEWAPRVDNPMWADCLTSLAHEWCRAARRGQGALQPGDGACDEGSGAIVGAALVPGCGDITEIVVHDRALMCALLHPPRVWWRPPPAR